MRVGGAPGALAVTREGVLVLDTGNGAVRAIDPRYRRDPQRLSRIAGFPTSLAVGARRRLDRRRAQRHRHALARPLMLAAVLAAAAMWVPAPDTRPGSGS